MDRADPTVEMRLFPFSSCTLTTATLPNSEDKQRKMMGRLISVG